MSKNCPDAPPPPPYFDSVIFAYDAPPPPPPPPPTKIILANFVPAPKTSKLMEPDPDEKE
jgi:hypothetical protein